MEFFHNVISVINFSSLLDVGLFAWLEFMLFMESSMVLTDSFRAATSFSTSSIFEDLV